MGKYVLEICASSFNSAVAACRAGAERLELCSGLGEGGITPSLGLMKAVMRLPNIRKHILIRPRGGDFLYSKEEIALMADDIKVARDAGADGIVVGALFENGDIDTESMKLFIEAAQGMDVTFHRAFDVCRSPLEALDTIISLGCSRILTSGQAATAAEGVSMLRQLIALANGRIIIMPGCGVNANNALTIIQNTGATEIHASASLRHQSRMTFRHHGVSMGKQDEDEYSVVESDEYVIKQIRENLNGN